MGFPVRPKISVLSRRWGQRGQVVGSLPRRQLGTATRWHRVGVVTPSLHLEVSDTDSRHLDVDWASGNRWAGRRVTPELGCFLTILTTFGWDGGLGDHTRPAGLRQGAAVCVHTIMDMEQLSDHKVMTPSGMGLLVCGAGSHPSCHAGVQGGKCQREWT